MKVNFENSWAPQTADEDGRMAVESSNYRRKLRVLSKIYSLCYFMHQTITHLHV